MNPLCEICGLEMEPDEVFPHRWVCPRNADAHALAAKLAACAAGTAERVRQINQLKEKLRNPDKRFAELQSERDDLKAKFAESEAKVKALEAKLVECCYVIRSMTSRAVLDGFESPDELEAWMKQIFKTGYKWLEGNRDLVKKDEEARTRKEPSMASENRCPKCGAPMCEEWSRELDENLEPIPYQVCSADRRDCRIKELESLLRASEAREREMQGKLDEARAAVWTLRVALAHRGHSELCAYELNGEPCDCAVRETLTATLLKGDSL